MKWKHSILTVIEHVQRISTSSSTASIRVKVIYWAVYNSIVESKTKIVYKFTAYFVEH